MDISELLRSRPQNRAARDWYGVRNLASGETEILIYDYIGYDPFFGGVGAQDFVRELRGIEASAINLRINSPGGDIADAIAMRNALIEHPATVTTYIDGLAASSASWVGMLPDSRLVMSPKAMLMIHEPWNVIAGDAEALKKHADVLDKMGGVIASIYADKAGGSAETWRDAMRAETWYTDGEAVSAKLADEVSGKPAASNRYDPAILGIYRNTPEHLRQPAPVVVEPPSNAEFVQAALEYQRDQARRHGVAA